MYVYAGQANVLDFPIMDAAGAPIVVGTVNVYLYCKTETNANKWYWTSDGLWHATEGIAGTATVKGSMGVWVISLPSAVWELNATYVAYAFEAVTPSIVVPQPLICIPKSVNISTETTVIEAP